MTARKIERIWKPLERKLGKKRCAGFMFMGRVNRINLYKHGIARMYLNLDDSGECYLYRGTSGFEKADFDTELRRIDQAVAELGETMETAYDESYIARKEQALEEAGIRLGRIEIQPEDLSIDEHASFNPFGSAS
jgi:hypothetical protein